jgi:hypothetical protein
LCSLKLLVRFLHAASKLVSKSKKKDQKTWDRQDLSAENKIRFCKVLQSQYTIFSLMGSGLYNILLQLLDWTQLIAGLYSVAGFIDDDRYKWLLPKSLRTESLISALNMHRYLILCYQQLSTSRFMECSFQGGLLQLVLPQLNFCLM